MLLLNILRFAKLKIGGVRYIAFTLAEVLITLGIIGIIAGMTIPALVQDIQRRDLEVAFKKSFSVLQQAATQALVDGPLDATGVEGTRSTQFIDAIKSKYSVSGSISNAISSEYQYKMRTYALKSAAVPQCSQEFYQGIIASDGSSIGFIKNCSRTYATIDTNGYSKGPNAFGHDIFLFVIDSVTGKVSSATGESERKLNPDGSDAGSYDDTAANLDKCSKTASSTVNGTTCVQFAIRNVCPDDASKTYWECLP